MKNLRGALCTGKWWLFDSTDPRDHVIARKLCEAPCPAFAACDQLRHELQTATRYFAHTDGPSGTWAGKLLGAPKKTGRPRVAR